jgi:hypothetical protein
MSTDIAYSRCKACNRSFYPAWREETKAYEDLCWTCMNISTYTARVDPILYGSGSELKTINPDKWEQSLAEDTKSYLNNLWEERPVNNESLYNEDEYLSGTGCESGDWFGKNNPFDTYEV